MYIYSLIIRKPNKKYLGTHSRPARGVSIHCNLMTHLLRHAIPNHMRDVYEEIIEYMCAFSCECESTWILQTWNSNCDAVTIRIQSWKETFSLFWKYLYVCVTLFWLWEERIGFIELRNNKLKTVMGWGQLGSWEPVIKF